MFSYARRLISKISGKTARLKERKRLSQAPGSVPSVTIPAGMNGDRYPFHGPVEAQVAFRVRLAECRAQSAARKASRAMARDRSRRPQAKAQGVGSFANVYNPVTIVRHHRQISSV